MIPAIFAKRSRFGSPTWGIVLASCVAWLCVIFDLESLIEMLNISYVLAAVLEIAAFLHLRYYRLVKSNYIDPIMCSKGPFLRTPSPTFYPTIRHVLSRRLTHCSVFIFLFDPDTYAQC